MDLELNYDKQEEFKYMREGWGIRYGGQGMNKDLEVTMSQMPLGDGHG